MVVKLLDLTLISPIRGWGSSPGSAPESSLPLLHTGRQQMAQVTGSLPLTRDTLAELQVPIFCLVTAGIWRVNRQLWGVSLSSLSNK